MATRLGPQRPLGAVPLEDRSEGLRLVVGAHTFAGGPPFGIGAHDLGRYRVAADTARSWFIAPL